ncbi:MAG: c-type cytochrome [Blastocatellia bacterium]|nr:c-type cytochrome [Blastocatellia bacterium]
MTCKMRIIKTGIAITCVAMICMLAIDAGARAEQGRAPDEAKKLKNPLTATKENIEAGHELYQMNCVICHGEDGKSKTRMASSMDPKPPDLTGKEVQSRTDGEIFWIITHGTKESVMPEYGATMSDTERWQLTLYVRRLAKPESK